MEESRTITYRGGPVGLQQLVRMLREEGVRVEWEPPEERRDLASMAQDYVVELLAMGTIAGIQLAVDRFRKRAGDRGTAEIEKGKDD
jgi:hypothetical protein